jgi:hypothetical protein
MDIKLQLLLIITIALAVRLFTPPAPKEGVTEFLEIMIGVHISLLIYHTFFA